MPKYTKGGQLVPASWEHGIDSASFLTPFFSFYLNSIDDLWQGLKTKKESDMAHYDEGHYARYTSFIQSRQNRTISEGTYTEKHHILPRSLGGSDEPENIIELTAREHFVAHLILWKVYGGPMATAFLFMSRQKQHKITNNRMYAIVREQSITYLSDCQRGVSRWTTEDRKRLSNSAKNRPPTSCETKAKISKIVKDRYRNMTQEDREELSKKISEGKKASGYIHSQETRQRISEMQTGKPGGKKPKHWCENMSRIHSGKVVSDEVREKIRDAVRGKKFIHRYVGGEIERKMLPEDVACQYVEDGWSWGKGVKCS